MIKSPTAAAVANFSTVNESSLARDSQVLSAPKRNDRFFRRPQCDRPVEKIPCHSLGGSISRGTMDAANIGDEGFDAKAGCVPNCCSACGKDAVKSCSKCHETFYCSVDCQRADWAAHKKVCGGGYVFKVKNRHPKQSPRCTIPQGPPPNINGSSGFDFVAYFDNDYGEQTLVLWDFDKSAHPFVLMGDYTWSMPLPLTGEASDFDFDDTMICFAGVVISTHEMHLLEYIFPIAKAKYELWVEAGGRTKVSSSGAGKPDIPYHDRTKSRKKAYILDVPNRSPMKAGLPPSLDAPSLISGCDTIENKTTSRGQKVAILKSPTYGHNTFYFDSAEKFGQIAMEWNMNESDTATVWSSYVGWDKPFEIGPEFLMAGEFVGPADDKARGRVFNYLQEMQLTDDDVLLVAMVYFVWNDYRNDMFKGDSIYDKAIEEAKAAEK